MAKPRKPLILDLDDDPTLRDGPGPAEAPPIEDTPDEAAAAGRALAAATAVRRGAAWGRLFGIALGGLVTLALALWIDSLITALFAQAALLGWLGVGLAGLLVAAILVFALGEIAGMARLGRVDTLRRHAEAARTGDSGAARQALAGLDRLLRRHVTAAPALDRLKAAQGDTPDPTERLQLAETLVMPALDAAAEAAVVRAARRVGALTAVVPLALLDIVLVLWATLSMVRGVAEAYGGRAGWLGSWRLLKAVVAQLVAAGLLSSTEDLLDPVLGQGIAGRLSRRLGEAAFNAAVTARVGAIAIQVCRPLPFAERSPPRARALLLRAIGDWKPKVAAGRNGH